MTLGASADPDRHVGQRARLHQLGDIGVLLRRVGIVLISRVLDEEHIAGGKRGRDHREHEYDVGLAEQSRILALGRFPGGRLAGRLFLGFGHASLLHLVLC